MSSAQPIKARFLNSMAQGAFRLANYFQKWAAGENAFQHDNDNKPLALTEVDPVEVLKRKVLVNYRKKEAAEYYEKHLNETQQFFIDEGYDVAGALFELLVEHKATKGLRNDGYNPGISHEIDQLLPTIRAMKEGKLREDLPAIEAMHGSFEQYLCAKIVHDMGEDFNLFYDDLVQKARARVYRNINYGDKPDGPDFELPEDKEDLIARAGRSMERLTHLRKFDLDEFENLTDGPLGLTGDEFDLLKNGQTIDLTSQYGDFFWNKINCFREEDHATSKHMQVFAVWNKKHNKPVIEVTQYGRSDKLGADWHLYMRVLGKHIYEMMAKLDDRVSNLATRFGSMGPEVKITNFDLDGHRDYFGQTQTLVEEVASGQVAAENYPNTPLEPYIKSINAMLGHLHIIGIFYIRHHPANDKELTKGMDPGNVTASSIYTSRFYDENKRGDINLLYAHTPNLSHPLYKMMMQLGDVTGQALHKGHRRLWRVLAQNAGDEGGPNIKNRMDGLLVQLRAMKHYTEEKIKHAVITGAGYTPVEW